MKTDEFIRRRRLQLYRLYPKTGVTFIIYVLHYIFLSFDRDGRKYDRTRYNNNVVSNDLSTENTVKHINCTTHYILYKDLNNTDQGSL